MTACFFSGRGACDGALVRAHIVPRQLLKREYRHGAVLDGGHWRRLNRNEDRYDLRHKTLRQLCDDERSWVPCCGGIAGNAGHHGKFDGLTLALARDEIPAAVEEFADELGLTWFLERRYGLIKQGEDECQ